MSHPTRHEAELYVEFAGCWRVHIYGADDYDRMRGIYLDSVVIDEFADFSPPCMVSDRAIDLSLGLIGATVVDSGTIPSSLNPLSLKRSVFNHSIFMIL